MLNRNTPPTTLVLLILGAALLIDLVGIVALACGAGGDRPVPQVLELIAVTTVTGMLALIAPGRGQAVVDAAPNYAGEHRGEPDGLS